MSDTLSKKAEQYIEEQLTKGIEDAQAGRLRSYSPQVLEDIKQNALKKIANRKPKA